MSYHRDRDPLTLRHARTMREVRRDPHDWWQGPGDDFDTAVRRVFNRSGRPRIRTRPSLVRRFFNWILRA